MTGDYPQARPDDFSRAPGAGPGRQPPPADPAPGTRPVGGGDALDPEDRPAPQEAGRGAASGRSGTSGSPEPLTIERTRTGGLWVAAISAAVVLLLLLIFILQNTEQVEVALFGANPDLPLGVALLLAAVLGALLVALIGTARIVQLRMIARRHRGEDRRARG